MPATPNRRDFVISAASAGAAACFVAGPNSSAQGVERTPKATSGDGHSGSKAVVDWPVWDQREETSLSDVLNSGQWGCAGGGRRVPEFEAAFAKTMKARYCVATASGTTALLTALGALGIGPGDEVVLPPYTFVATFNVITNSYALPVFVDTDLETFQIDPKKIPAAITPNTKLLMPVHIGGSPADLDAVNTVAKTHNIPVLEDACQAVLAELHGQPVGTIGLGGCFSFQASKNLNSGEGGAVLTNDEAFANLCYNFHTPGGGKPGASSGRGANYRLTEFQGGLLLAQMTRLEEQAKLRDANAAYLTELLKKIPGLAPARLVNGCTRSAWHLYMFRYEKQHFAGLPRARFLEELGKAGIGASGGYGPLDKSGHVRALAANPHYQRLYGKERMARWAEANQCPVNDQLCEQGVWFTQTKLLTNRGEMERIAEAIAGIQKRAGELMTSRS
jgi:dTDP-4-amino-4,6-dideoxygalactose transaminase